MTIDGDAAQRVESGTTWRLNCNDVFHYMVRRGLVELSTLVDGGVHCAEIEARNRVIFFERDCDGTGLLLKQASAQGCSTEPAIYSLAWDSDVLAALRPWMPKLISYDRLNDVLVTELLPNRTDLLRAYHRGIGVPPSVYMNLGLGLGTVHQYSPHEILSATGNYDHNHLWPLRHHLRSDSDATPEFIGTALAIRSRPALCAQIEGLNEHLAAMPNTLVHGDARWQNVLVHYGDDGQLTTDEAVTLIDWEFAGEGPPGWDVGGIIQSFLAFHLLRPNADPASAVRHLLDTDQDCIVALLRGYCTLEHAWASPPQVVRWSVECAVGHLMQSVYDSGSRSHADSLYVGKLLETVAILAGAHDDIAATILRAIVEC